jgi:5'-nucleotidase
LPHPGPEIDEVDFVFCPVDPSPLPLSYRVEGTHAEYVGSYPDRPRRPGWDVDVCLGGRVSISLVHVMASVERFDAGGEGLPGGPGTKA